MKTLMVGIFFATLLSGCGVDTVATMGTAAVVKKEEMEHAQKALQRAQQDLDIALKNQNARRQMPDEKP